jgi:organic radical activating enzyme
MTDFQNIPFHKIVKLGQSTLLHKDLFTVSWIIDRFCNYNCTYCWPYARSNTTAFLDFSVYENAILRIKDQARKNGFQKFHFSFSGGEPTAYLHLLKLIDVYAKDNIDYQSIHMTTNLSPSLKWWNKWVKKVSKLSRKSITASYHDEFADEDEFIKKCVFLQEHDIFITINQVMVPSRFDLLYERCVRFKNAGINVTLKPQSDPTAKFIVNDYTDDQIKILKTGFPQEWKGVELLQVELYDNDNNVYYLDQAERMNAFKFNKFKGWNCNAGFQSIIIREDEIKRSYSCADDPIGKIYEDFNIFTAVRKCVTDSCVSSADSKIPKEYIIK